MKTINISKIDDIFDWVRANKLRLEQFKSFKNAAISCALDVFKESHPDDELIKTIIFYLKLYTPMPRITCGVCNGSGKIIAFGVGRVYNPKTLDCKICNGSGRDLSMGKIEKSLTS